MICSNTAYTQFNENSLIGMMVRGMQPSTSNHPMRLTRGISISNERLLMVIDEVIAMVSDDLDETGHRGARNQGSDRVIEFRASQ
jgi:hypothetical protein